MSMCDHCNRPIAGTTEDPIVWTSLGRHHYACMREAWGRARRASAARRSEIRERRSAAAKVRWHGSPVIEHETVVTLPDESAPPADDEGPALELCDPVVEGP